MNKDLPYFDRVLADCLEAMIMDGRSIPSLLHQYPEYRDELSELLTVAKVAHKLPGLELEPMPQPEPQVQIEHEPAAPRSFIDEIVPWILFLLQQIGPAPKPRLATASWALAATLIVALLAGTGTGVAYAAEGASPGDLLYGLDRATESVRMALTFDPAEKAQFGLRLAQERLAEAETLSERNSPVRYIYQALADYQAQVESVALLVSEVEGQLNNEHSQALERAISNAQANQELTIGLVANTVTASGGSTQDKNESATQNRPAEPPAQPPSNAVGLSAVQGEQTAPGVGRISQSSNSAVGLPGLHGRLQALEAHLNQAELEIERGNPQGAKIELAKHDNQVHLLAQALMKLEDGATRQQALQAILNQAHSRRHQVLSQLLEQLPPAARAGLERALSAGGGPPDGVPGSGPPDDVPGNGPPEDKPGGRPPDTPPGQDKGNK